MSTFEKEFQDRFIRYYDESSINRQIEQVLTLKGSYSSVQGVIDRCIYIYAVKFEEVQKNTPLELKHCIESFKLSRIGKSNRTKYKNIVLDVVNNSIKKFNNSYLKDFFISHANLAEELKPYIVEVLPRLHSRVEDINFELDKIITDYNNNTNNFWGRNKDKLITPIIVSFITTLVTLIITFIVTKYILGWFN